MTEQTTTPRPTLTVKAWVTAHVPDAAPVTLTAPSPSAVNVDAGRTGAHHAHAERLAAAVRDIAPDVHVRIGDLSWSVRLSVDPIERHGLGEVTVRVPTPWDVRDGVPIARRCEWTVYRSQPLTSPATYPHDVHAAARAAVRLLGRALTERRAERFHAARDWYYAAGASSWWADAFGQWVAECTAPGRWATYSAALPEWLHGDEGRAYREAHGRRLTGDGWTYGEPLVTDAPVPTATERVAAAADRARARAAAAGEYVAPLVRVPRN